MNASQNSSIDQPESGKNGIPFSQTMVQLTKQEYIKSKVAIKDIDGNVFSNNDFFAGLSVKPPTWDGLIQDIYLPFLARLLGGVQPFKLGIARHWMDGAFRLLCSEVSGR